VSARFKIYDQGQYRLDPQPVLWGGANHRSPLLVSRGSIMYVRPQLLKVLKRENFDAGFSFYTIQVCMGM
jgi:hypothetical protein